MLNFIRKPRPMRSKSRFHRANAGLNGGSGPTFNFWNSLTIPAGQKGIFAQTDFTENFDTSDFGVFGAFPPAALNPTSPYDCNSP
jgi:hypothetical protein